MKFFLQSKVIQGALLSIVTLALGVFGVSVSSQEINTVTEGLVNLWPSLLAIGTAAGAAWFRIKAIRFDKSLLLSRTFWLALSSGFLSIIGAVGIPTAEFETFFEALFSLITSAGPVIGAVIMIYGRAKAKMPVTVRRAEVVK